MKIVVQVIRGILIGLLGLNLFIWLMAYMRSHSIPADTNLGFGVTSIILLFLIIVLSNLRKK